IGQATSLVFSPILKKYLALGTLRTEYLKLDREIEIEVTVEYERRRAPAKVSRLPFFDPPRKKGDAQSAAARG
ncbi:MAG TPA: glycine cleavage T C-terminal barrel domain-containing protein, partial [Anaerolineales bacterium]|nr:glycine cleavage T C-terminal barrel domain-containing protein [Anaerolineales bacterium]